jgi:hypothetical protein
VLYHPSGGHGQQFQLQTQKHKQNTHKTLLLASNYGTDWSLVVYENCTPQNRPSTQLIDATSCIKMWDTTIGVEELSYISQLSNVVSRQKLEKLLT